MKLTRIHLGLGLDEVGVQFELDDGAGGTVTQRSFVTLPADATTAVWSATQTAVAAQLAELPTDMPPGAVTNALMKARNARQEAEVAERKRVEAEIARNAAADEAEQTRAAIATAKAKHDAEMAAAKEKHDAEVTARMKALADLDKQIQAKREEIAQPSDGTIT